MMFDSSRKPTTVSGRAEKATARRSVKFKELRLQAAEDKRKIDERETSGANGCLEKKNNKETERLI